MYRADGGRTGMVDFLGTIEGYIEDNKMLCPGDYVVVGLSGGADSTALLRLLAGLRDRYCLELGAVHVHHGIRGAAADSDEEFCVNLCDCLGVELETVHVDVPARSREERISLEEAGRLARQAAFQETAQRLWDRGRRCVVALAHHMDDQAETVLMNLARGSSVRGLAGIRPVHSMEGHGAGEAKGRRAAYTVIRPLLCVRKTDITEWLSSIGQGYCVDATNADLEYTRNRLRNSILPMMEEGINRRVVENVANAAGELARIDEYICRMAEKARESCVTRRGGCISICRDGLAGLEGVIADRLVMDELVALAGRAKDIYSVHVRAVLGLLGKNVGSRVSLPYGMRAVAGYDDITICTGSMEDSLGDGEFWTPDGIVTLVGGMSAGDAVEPSIVEGDAPEENVCTKYFDYDKIEGDLQLRTRRSGDMLCVYGDGRRKKLKNYLVEQKVPERYRDRVLLVACGSDVLWVVGMRVSEYHRAGADTRHWCSVTLPLKGLEGKPWVNTTMK